MVTRSGKILYAAALAGLILAIGCYYLYVLGLNARRDVSDSFRYYYLDKQVRFWNKYQSMYVVPGRVYDVTVERPYFLAKPGFSAPASDGSGMTFAGRGGLIFKLYRVPEQLWLRLRLATDSGDTLITLGGKAKAFLADPGGYELYLPVDPKLLRAGPAAVNRVPLSASLPVRVRALGLTSAGPDRTGAGPGSGAPEPDIPL